MHKAADLYLQADTVVEVVAVYKDWVAELEEDRDHRGHPMHLVVVEGEGDTGQEEVRIVLSLGLWNAHWESLSLY